MSIDSTTIQQLSDALDRNCTVALIDYNPEDDETTRIYMTDIDLSREDDPTFVFVAFCEKLYTLARYIELGHNVTYVTEAENDIICDKQHEQMVEYYKNRVETPAREIGLYYTHGPGKPVEEKTSQ